LFHLFFAAVERGEVMFSSFDREWADPTYKLLRVLIIIFALVVAYPYIPGSGSEAFKGISIFMGIIFSLGASSAVANLIAGYMLTYPRQDQRHHGRCHGHAAAGDASAHG
jgi:small-conductance mechanosensitive channel